MALAAPFYSCILLYIVSRYIYGTPFQVASQTLYAMHKYPEEARGPTVCRTLLFAAFAFGGSDESRYLAKGDVSKCD